MEIIAYRTIESPYKDDYREIKEFPVLGTSPEPYAVWLFIDNFNVDCDLVEYKCTCPHFHYRGIECKHIKACSISLERTLKFNLNIDQEKICKLHKSFGIDCAHCKVLDE